MRAREHAPFGKTRRKDGSRRPSLQPGGDGDATGPGNRPDQAGRVVQGWAHGYPFHTVRWHFHPEYELHHVVATTGHYFVGDFIGEFGPGNLVLTGPNLPHNWISDVPPGTHVPLRGRIVQFSEELIAQATAPFQNLPPAQGSRSEPPRGAVLRPPSTLSVPCCRSLWTLRASAEFPFSSASSEL